MKKKPRIRTNKELETLRRMVGELAHCEWQGKSVTLQRLIIEAREMSGWKKKDLWL